MIDLDVRTTILALARQGHGNKTIARWVGVSKTSVKKVIRSGQAGVPALERAEILDPHIDHIRKLYGACKGNLVRVHEELAGEGVDVAYPTLTAFCRRRGLGRKPKPRAGRYVFAPGEEMQHDTSPHAVRVGDRTRNLQCASLILCYSRKQYAQLYPRWTRFEARCFLSEALEWIGGAAGRCMLDNSTVIMIGGTGKHAVASPEMKALADRFGFTFVAHEVGDADRSAHVERIFDYIDNNFYAGRTFADLADLNRQLRQWCETNFQRYRKGLQARASELFVAERPHIKPLPAYIPEVYELHSRRVDVEGYVNLHTNRYSVDDELIGKRVEVRETVTKVRVFDGHRLAEEHDKLEYGARKRQTLDKHQGPVYRNRKPLPPSPKEQLLRGQGPEFGPLIDALRKRYGGRAVKSVRQLHRIWADYPLEPVRRAVSVALKYGLIDLKRIETMVLRHIAGNFFELPVDDDEDSDD